MWKRHQMGEKKIYARHAHSIGFQPVNQNGEVENDKSRSCRLKMRRNVKMLFPCLKYFLWWPMDTTSLVLWLLFCGVYHICT